MYARDVMTTDVVSARSDTPTGKIAELLLSRGISAVPIVDSGGAPIGMVSEGDLVGRDEKDREARRDWWLTLLAEGTPLSADFLASLRHPQSTAREIMSAPVVTIEEDTPVAEIARLLAAYRIKRVPVVRDGQIVGIVSRADLLRALAAQAPESAAPDTGGLVRNVVDTIDRYFKHKHPSVPDHPPDRPSQPAGEDGLTVENFRHLLADFEHGRAAHQDEVRRAAAEQRRQKTKELIDRHISDGNWRAILHQARQAAEHGQREIMLFGFPSQLCSDGGRAINALEPDWARTLRGEAAEIYLRWERDLKPHGFGLAARVLDFPGGMPGAIGLFLLWGEG
jgi:CBS domain-containing protein